MSKEELNDSEKLASFYDIDLETANSRLQYYKLNDIDFKIIKLYIMLMPDENFRYLQNIWNTYLSKSSDIYTKIDGYLQDDSIIWFLCAFENIFIINSLCKAKSHAPDYLQDFRNPEEYPNNLES